MGQANSNPKNNGSGPSSKPNAQAMAQAASNKFSSGATSMQGNKIDLRGVFKQQKMAYAGSLQGELIEHGVWWPFVSIGTGLLLLWLTSVIFGKPTILPLIFIDMGAVFWIDQKGSYRYMKWSTHFKQGLLAVLDPTINGFLSGILQVMLNAVN
jgi:hypothetical protein